MPAVTPIFNKNVLFIIICFLAGKAFLPAQESLELEVNEPVYEVSLPSPWYEGLFIESSGLVYFAPSLIKDYIKPGFGFRAALGYEYRRFRLAIESGYSGVAGTDSLVSQIGFAPLVFKFGYGLPLFSIFGLQADLSAGAVFSKTTRYPTAIDLAMNKNLREDRENSFMAGGRLYATATPLEFLRVYAGGGVDVIFEKDGPLALPLLEIGLHFKPFVLLRKSPEPQEKIIEEIITAREELVEEINTIIEEQEITGLTVEATDEGVLLRLWDIHFLPDSAVLLDSEQQVLQEVANILRNLPGRKIRVEGHTAMAGTRERRLVFSRQRAQAVASYLISLGVVNADDVTVIGYGADRPIADNVTEEGRAANRHVEIIILDNVETNILENEENGEIIILEELENEG
jgi:outer membrane protein OmpA-like peptidoglycan-associated protein